MAAAIKGSPQLTHKVETRRRKDSAKSLGLDEGKRGSAGSDQEGEPSPRVNRKFIENWRHACDRTKDRTKELLKKWRTLPEPEFESDSAGDEEQKGWSEHVWTTWVKRCPNEEDSQDFSPITLDLTPIQKEKFGHFFIHLLDMDCDDVISLCDFENLFERFRHFADWSKNSAEHHRLLEVQRGFTEHFLIPPEVTGPAQSDDAMAMTLRTQQLGIDDWLMKWSEMLAQTHNFLGLPLWLQYFPVILFQVINKSGSGYVSRSELSTFYTSVVGIPEQEVSNTIQNVYSILTSNGDHLLDSNVYRLSFANFVLGRFPNGPGLFLFYPLIENEAGFPIDYKAMSCAPEDLEQYTPKVKTNRRSVIV